MHTWPLAILLLAYLVGAVPFGYLVARAKGIDIFAHGSGNIGATNVGRILGRPYGILVFVLDALKGAGPVAFALAAKSWLELGDSFWAHGWLEVLAGLSAFLGHCFPIYLGFRGGKGVATGAGVVAVLLPLPALAALLAWLVTVASTRYVSLASSIAPLVMTGVYVMQNGWSWDDPRLLFCLLAGGLIVWRHRSNLGRVLRGDERQIREIYLMQSLTRTMHVLALGLWFGMSIFFTFVVTLSLFASFKQASEELPNWFPRGKIFEHKDGNVDGPKEQGSRAAGHAVGPLFDTYFPLSGAAGLVALLTSLGWAKLGGKHKTRFAILALALTGVLVGWPIERKVHDLRVKRSARIDAHLTRIAFPPETRKCGSEDEFVETAKKFADWHLASLFLNLAVCALVTLGMGLAGHLPTTEPRPSGSENSQGDAGS